MAETVAAANNYMNQKEARRFLEGGIRNSGGFSLVTPDKRPRAKMLDSLAFKLRQHQQGFDRVYARKVPVCVGDDGEKNLLVADYAFMAEGWPTPVPLFFTYQSQGGSAFYRKICYFCLSLRYNLATTVPCLMLADGPAIKHAWIAQARLRVPEYTDGKVTRFFGSMSEFLSSWIVVGCPYPARKPLALE